jgi:hypothetical protein
MLYEEKFFMHRYSVADPGCFIPDPGSEYLFIPDPGSRIPDPSPM